MHTVEMTDRARRLWATLDTRDERSALAEFESLAVILNTAMHRDEPVAVPTAAVLANDWPAVYRAAAALLRRGAVLIESEGGPICGPGSELWDTAVECDRQAEMLSRER